MNATGDECGFAVVAVDGSDEGLTAVRFAAERASREHVSLRLAHVMPASVPIGPLLMIATEEGMAGFANEAMGAATRLVAEVAPDVETSAHILLGGRVSQIVSLAEHASFVVVGRRLSSALDRFWSGGTLDGVVSRSSAPVFVVPPEQAAVDGTPRVVAGYKEPEHAAELFDAAFAAADELGAEVEIVHAWKLLSGYDDMISRRVSEARWNGEKREEIWRAVAPWQDAYPHVPIRIRVVHEYPARALVEASRQASRLVLVKPLHGGAVHHLGRTARGALRLAACPIEVVPAKRPEELIMPPVTLESEGELVR